MDIVFHDHAQPQIGVGGTDEHESDQGERVPGGAHPRGERRLIESTQPERRSGRPNDERHENESCETLSPPASHPVPCRTTIGWLAECGVADHAAPPRCRSMMVATVAPRMRVANTTIQALRRAWLRSSPRPASHSRCRTPLHM